MKIKRRMGLEHGQTRTPPKLSRGLKFTGLLVAITATVVCLVVFVFLGVPIPFVSPYPPPKVERAPSWSPEGHLVYECYREGPVEWGTVAFFEENYDTAHASHYKEEAADICIRDVVDGGEEIHLLQQGGDWQPTWSPDGTYIAYWREDGIYLLTLENWRHQQLIPFLQIAGLSNSRKYGNLHLAWSPDSSQLLLTGCANGRDWDVYVVDVATGEMRNLTPDDQLQALVPFWARDGMSIIYESYSSSEAECSAGYRAQGYQLQVMEADGNNRQIIGEQSLPYSFISVTNQGKVSYSVSDRARQSLQMQVVDLQGYRWYKSIEGIRLPHWSPNEDALAFEWAHGLAVLETVTGKALQWTTFAGFESLTWSPDGTMIAGGVKTYSHLLDSGELHIFVYRLVDGSVVHTCLEPSAALCDEHIDFPPPEPIQYLRFPYRGCPGEIVDFALKSIPGHTCDLSLSYYCGDGIYLTTALERQIADNDSICRWQWQLPVDLPSEAVVRVNMEVGGNLWPSFDIRVVPCD